MPNADHQLGIRHSANHLRLSCTAAAYTLSAQACLRLLKTVLRFKIPDRDAICASIVVKWSHMDRDAHGQLSLTLLVNHLQAVRLRDLQHVNRLPM